MANTFLPSENEWYKAAYYSPGGVYFDYPTGTDLTTVCAAPTATPNTANCANVVGAVGVPAVGAVTDVGAYTGSASPYGTFDQGGNVAEWNEEIAFTPEMRGNRGGSWFLSDVYLAAGSPTLGAHPDTELYFIGFRVASAIPEPSTGLLVMTGLLGLAYRQRRHGRAA